MIERGTYPEDTVSGGRTFLSLRVVEDKWRVSEGLWLADLQGPRYLRFATAELVWNLYSTFPSEAGAGSLGQTGTRPFFKYQQATTFVFERASVSSVSKGTRAITLALRTYAAECYPLKRTRSIAPRHPTLPCRAITCRPFWGWDRFLSTGGARIEFCNRRCRASFYIASLRARAAEGGDWETSKQIGCGEIWLVGVALEFQLGGAENTAPCDGSFFWQDQAGVFEFQSAV